MSARLIKMTRKLHTVDLFLFVVLVLYRGEEEGSFVREQQTVWRLQRVSAPGRMKKQMVAHQILVSRQQHRIQHRLIQQEIAHPLAVVSISVPFVLGIADL